MPRYKVTLEYDGSRYSGWQVQRGAKTVQGELIYALKEVFGEVGEVMGSGRTDAGVHALKQVAHVDLRKSVNEKDFMFGVNDKLPHDINILKVEQTFEKFHARYSAIKRSYVYQISTCRNAFGKNHSWWIKDSLNIGSMRRAVSMCIGMNDFFCFTEIEKNSNESTKVLVESLDILQQENLILIKICASHFLWKMVRRLTGALVEIGRGSLSLYEFESALKLQKGQLKFTAPPSGLFLEQVIYKDDIYNKELKPINLFVK